MRRNSLSLLCCLALVSFLVACSGSKTVVVQNVTVVINEQNPTVNIFSTKQFSVTVTGTTNTAVNWQVNGVTGGSATSGFISTSGLFLAPTGVPTTTDGKGHVVTTTVTVTAVSQVNSTATGSTKVTIFPTNQNAQTGAIELGASGGNANDFSQSGNTITCCGGTLGSLVTRSGTQFILSNNHVLARSDSGIAGESIIQPGLVDTGNCTVGTAATVANLSEFFNLETGPSPKIDAALAQVIPNKVDATGNILFLGATVDANNVPLPGAPHAGPLLPAVINHPVAKSGRSTGLTCSTISSTSTMASVVYQKMCTTDPNVATFTVNYTNLVSVLGGSFSAEGDSGSLIVTQDTADPIALLFAGSDTDTVGNPVSDVLSFFVGAGNATPTFVGGAAHAVIGCTLPTKPASAIEALAATAVAAEALQRATTARDAHGAELLSHPEVQAVGVGPSYDNPKEGAILLFVTKGQPHADIPAQVDGVRTRIIEGDLFASRGEISAAESAALEQSAAPPQLIYSISDAEVARAKIVHAAHAASLMKQSGVQGVGITSSVDSPGEAALMIFTIRGVPQDPIPPVIDGLRIRVRESSRFHAGYGDSQPHRACTVPAKIVKIANVGAVPPGH
jgi:hypothetical protein